MQSTSRIAIEPIGAFADNYIWWLSDGHTAIVVDPGDAAPVIAKLKAGGQTLGAILVTHHHADHVGGVDALVQLTNAPVYGPQAEAIAGVTVPLSGGERLPLLGESIEVLAVPGHTRAHIAYYCGELSAVFCGDTLFACGCGRVFEGTAEQMAASLNRLGALPDATKVYCAHEYTLANIRFALTVEPDNPRLQVRSRSCEQLRAAGLPTVPSTIAEERATNPFLRCSETGVRARASIEDPAATLSVDATFAVLRSWKNRFR
jgi:hydroxyacylglutathione hydrolase